MAAYLNQNYYGNESYGVAAAAQGYFGIDLKDLTLAQAAILAALPKSPSTYDLVQNAVLECLDPGSDPTDTGDTCKNTQLVVPADSAIVQRRNDGPRPHGAGPHAADRGHLHRGRLRGRPQRARRPRRPAVEPVAGVAVRVAGPQGADDPAVRRRRLDLRQARAGRAARSRPRSTCASRASPRSG